VCGAVEGCVKEGGESNGFRGVPRGKTGEVARREPKDTEKCEKKNGMLHMNSGSHTPSMDRGGGAVDGMENTAREEHSLQGTRIASTGWVKMRAKGVKKTEVVGWSCVGGGGYTSQRGNLQRKRSGTLQRYGKH